MKRVRSSAGVAESSVGARQGAKTSAGVDILTPTQPHLIHDLRVQSSAGVAESSVSARQGAKTSAGINILTPIQPHLIYDLTLIILRLKLIIELYLYSNVTRAIYKL
jgi:hypothetical protein